MIAIIADTEDVQICRNRVVPAPISLHIQASVSCGEKGIGGSGE